MNTLTTTFHPFPRLPLELRDQIWQDALPDDSGPTLYFYRRRRHWRRYLLPESDPGYRPGEDDMGLRFRTDLMDEDNQFEVPLVFVNREARRVALKWLDNQGIEIRRQTNGTRTFLFVRPFNPKLDTLYISTDKWEDFCREPRNRLSEPDLMDIGADLHCAVETITVSDTTFLDTESIYWLPELDIFGLLPRILFVIVDRKPDGLRGPWRWEVEGSGGWWLSWNNENGEFDFHKGSMAVVDEGLRKAMEEVANGGLRNDLATRDLKDFEIRPVFAVRRY